MVLLAIFRRSLERRLRSNLDMSAAGRISIPMQRRKLEEDIAFSRNAPAEDMRAAHGDKVCVEADPLRPFPMVSSGRCASETSRNASTSIASGQNTAPQVARQCEGLSVVEIALSMTINPPHDEDAASKFAALGFPAAIASGYRLTSRFFAKENCQSLG